MRLFLPVLILYLLLPAPAGAQSSYVPLGSYSIHLLDRMEIKQGRLAEPSEFNTTSKAYQRERIAQYTDSFDIISTRLSRQDYFNLAYLQNDNFEYSNSESTRTRNGLFGTPLFRHKAALYDASATDFKLVINPVAYQKLEYDRLQGDLNYLNTRGLELRGKIGSHVSFYTLYCDELQRVNSWNQQFYNDYRALPGMAFLKTDDGRNFNYWLASGYLSFQAGKYFDVQFGHGRNFLGNGYRSLMMSDFSRDHLFLRVNTRIWKVNYTNIWGEMYDYVANGQSRLPKRHYYATTHASINITKKLNIGLFQTISFQRDSGYANPGYDAQYLNPIIFYKPIENGLNSPDKAMVGADLKYNFARHFSVYSQLVLSELILKNVLARNGWYGNKNAIQLGIKYIDVFNIPNLDLQLEMNQARPYMYTSFNPKNAYVNYNQNMAHPTGANFREFISIVRYQPFDKLFVTLRGIHSTYGNDTNGSNWGRDIRRNYYEYEREYGNTIGQGVTTRLYIGEVVLSYMIWHNMFIDLQVAYRKTSADIARFNTETLNAGVAFRWNIAPRFCDF
jgi:hypothetical protein